MAIHIKNITDEATVDADISSNAVQMYSERVASDVIRCVVKLLNDSMNSFLSCPDRNGFQWHMEQVCFDTIDYSFDNTSNPAISSYKIYYHHNNNGSQIFKGLYNDGFNNVYLYDHCNIWLERHEKSYYAIDLNVDVYWSDTKKVSFVYSLDTELSYRIAHRIDEYVTEMMKETLKNSED